MSALAGGSGWRRWTPPAAAILLCIYVGIMGLFVARVPGLDSSGCPPSPTACDPLPVTPHRAEGFALLGLGAGVLLVTVVALIGSRVSNRQGTSTGWSGSSWARRPRVPTIISYAVGLLMLALGATVVALIVRSPVECLAGPNPPPVCPPAGLPPLLLATAGAIVVAVAVVLAARSFRRPSEEINYSPDLGQVP